MAHSRGNTLGTQVDAHGLDGSNEAEGGSTGR
jgi:hypothetical protein